jgi:hypothetical protein
MKAEKTLLCSVFAVDSDEIVIAEHVVLRPHVRPLLGIIGFDHPSGIAVTAMS